MSSPSTPDWIDALLAKVSVADGPGVAVGVSRGDETLCCTAVGLGHIEMPSPLTVDTLLPIASITKQMTALCALILESEGVLSLDAPVGEYLKELPAETGRPTLRQLLSHVSGLRCHLDVELFSGFTAPRPDGFGLETLKRLTSVNAPPGAWQVYGNSGYHLVSRVIERLTGAPFDDVMRERIFAPLAMVSACVARSAAYVTPGLASLYSRTPDGSWSNQSHLRVESIGEGGVCASLVDMMKWARALRTEDPRIDERLWRTLKSPVLLTDGTASEYALGVCVNPWRGVTLIGHSGMIIGQSSALVYVPEFDIDIVILANTTVPADGLARQLLEGFVGPEALAPAAPYAMASDYPALVGTVYEAADLCIGFGDHGGRLTLSLQGVDGAPLQTQGTAGELVVPTNLGAIRIRPSLGDDHDSLHVSFGGELHVATAQEPLDGQQAAKALADAAGIYACRDLGSFIEISPDRGEGVQVEARGAYGSYSGVATALTQRILKVTTPHLAYLLRLERDGETVTGVGFDTIRTRNLRFQRL